MVRRRASDAGIETAIGCQTFRATGITDYLTNGGRIEVAQHMAGHSNARTTGLYDRRNEDKCGGSGEDWNLSLCYDSSGYDNYERGYSSCDGLLNHTETTQRQA